MPQRQNRSCEGTKAKDSRMKVIQKNWDRKTSGYTEEGEWGDEGEVGHDRLWVSGQVVLRMGNHWKFKAKLLRLPFIKYHYGRRMEDGIEGSKTGERPTRRQHRKWFMIKLTLNTTFVAKRSQPSWNYWQARTLVQGCCFYSSRLLGIKRGSGLCNCGPVSKYNGNVVTQGLSWVGLTESFRVPKLKTLDASEDAEPEAGPVDVCAISESPSALQLLNLDNAHSCLGKGPQKLPWYLWLKFQKR